MSCMSYHDLLFGTSTGDHVFIFLVLTPLKGIDLTLPDMGGGHFDPTDFQTVTALLIL